MLQCEAEHTDNMRVGSSSEKNKEFPVGKQRVVATHNGTLTLAAAEAACVPARHGAAVGLAAGISARNPRPSRHLQRRCTTLTFKFCSLAKIEA